MNIDMMVFGEDWGSHPSSTQHLMRHLMPEQKLLWINSLGMRRPRLNMRDCRRALNKLRAMMSAPQTQAPDPFAPSIVNPRSIPLPGSQLARRINRHLLCNSLRPLISDSSAKRPLLWTSLPTAVDLVGQLGERASIYYCGDDFAALDGVDHGPVAAMEQELVEKADLIIAASEVLAQRFPQHKTLLLPHGVDVERFSTPVERAADLPTGLTAGFYGNLAGWFDQELLIATARRLPYWNFVLIGPANCDISALLAEPNIRWLGPRSHAELAAYSQHWTVGIMPFKNNAQIQACNPLKLREYLAAGSAVATTEYPALEGYRDLIQVGRDSRSFAEAIVNAGLGAIRQRSERRARVADQDWGQRARVLRDALQSL